MKQFTRNLIFAAVLAMMASCAAVEQIPGPDDSYSKLKVFTALIGADTKTAVDASTGKVRWEAGDEISILDGASNVRVVIGAEDISDDGRSAVFSAEVAEADEYVAVYPYSASNGYDADGIYLLAGHSSSQCGSFNDSHIAVACSSDGCGSFSFHNITGVLHFSISDPDISSVSFRGEAFERLTGPANFLVDETDYLAEWCGDGGTVINVALDGSGDYFLGTLGTEFPKGFSISCYDGDGSLCGSVSTGRKLDLEAGKIVNLGSLDSRIVAESDPVSTFPYSESFGSSKGEFTIRNVKLPSASSYVWYCDTQYGMKASSYISNKAYEAESWLISPFIDLTSAESAVLSFDHAANKFSGHDPEEQMHVMASCDGVNWTELDVPSWPSGNDWNFVGSGDISLAQFVGGKVQIAFVYTATTSVCGTWEIKNFKVCEGEGGVPVPPDPDEGKAFFATVLYGIYQYGNGAPIKTYSEFTEQFGVSPSSFFVADPAAQKYFRLKGIPATIGEGDRFSVSVDGNISGAPSGNLTVTVGKVDADTVWLYSESGIGFIIKK